MTRAALRELAWIVGALAVSVTVVLATSKDAVRAARGASSHTATVIVDASGFRVAPRTFHRVASGSILADRLLIELSEPERIVGLSRYGRTDSAFPFHYGTHPDVDPNGDIESLVALAPDLLLLNNFVDPRRVERLREAGIVVFDLGEMHGTATLRDDIVTVARLLGDESRGLRLADRFERRMASVARDVPMSRRPHAMYLGIHGTQLYGGTAGTSYHDVLEAAGLVDVAATRYSGWPSMTSEDILALDPQIIVSPNGQGRAICRHVGLTAVAACRDPHGIVAIEGALLVEPGLTMLEAAEAVRDAVHGRAASTEGAP